MKGGRETSAGSRRVSYHACAGVSLTTSDVFVTCDTTHRTGLRAKLQLKRGCVLENILDNLKRCRELHNLANLVGSGKDGKCLLCGLDFKISGQNTWRSLKNKDLRDRVCRLLNKTPDFERESTRLCKK